MAPPRLGVTRQVLADMLRTYGEDDLADRALGVTDEELERIGILGYHYAFSKAAMDHYGGSMGGARALSFAALDVLDGTGRGLRRTRSQGEIDAGLPEEMDESESAAIRALRRIAPQ